jgi:hypothetical protein
MSALLIYAECHYFEGTNFFVGAIILLTGEFSAVDRRRQKAAYKAMIAGSFMARVWTLNI